MGRFVGKKPRRQLAYLVEPEEEGDNHSQRKQENVSLEDLPIYVFRAIRSLLGRCENTFKSSCQIFGNDGLQGRRWSELQTVKVGSEPTRL